MSRRHPLAGTLPPTAALCSAAMILIAAGCVYIVLIAAKCLLQQSAYCRKAAISCNTLVTWFGKKVYVFSTHSLLPTPSLRWQAKLPSELSLFAPSTRRLEDLSHSAPRPGRLPATWPPKQLGLTFSVSLRSVR